MADIDQRQSPECIAHAQFGARFVFSPLVSLKSSLGVEGLEEGMGIKSPLSFTLQFPKDIL